MIFKILKNDLKRNRVISSILLLFIIFSSLLVAGSVTVVSSLQNSVDNLFEKADALHFLQMHAGEIDQDAIDHFAENNLLVKKYQTIEMINIEGDFIFLTDDKIPLSGSAIDLGFVMQSVGFDYLLDLNNEIISVQDGEIAIPIFYMTNYDLSIGDKIFIRDGDYSKTFTISSFLRDSQMNSTLASSKRFLVSVADHAELKLNTGNLEYLIEFQLTDVKHVNEFAAQYIEANLPSQGPTIDYSLLRIINMISDGIVAAVIILAGVLLVLISLLCLRFVILATLEEDMLEIGVMKAIGISHKQIRMIYTIKYLFFASIGCVLGYLLSLLFSNVFTQNVALYMGTPSVTIGTLLFPILAVLLISLLIIFYCRKLVNSIRNISAVEAMYPERRVKTKKSKAYLSIKRFKRISSSNYMSIQDIIVRSKTFLSLLILYIICVVLILIPINLLNTLQSPSFIEYMGVSQSDVRIDLLYQQDSLSMLPNILNELENDNRVERWAAFSTYKLKLNHWDGSVFTIDVETGDFTIFPIEYLEGALPIEEGEIALSYLWAKELNYRVGDTIEIQISDQSNELMVISGIYQDITNGGKTAKAKFQTDENVPIRSMININFFEPSDISLFHVEYSEAFPTAKITDVEDYLDQTFGSMIAQIQSIVIATILISSMMFLLIVSLFLKLMLAKDTRQNIIMMSIGFTRKSIRIQYFKKILGLLIIGIILGTFITNTLGQLIVRLVFTNMGLPKLRFVINPIHVYALIPLLLLLILSITTWLGTRSVKNRSISTLNAN